MSSPTSRAKRFLSRNSLDIANKPSQYFNSYSLMTGVVNYKGAMYSLKKIDLKEEINIQDLPEIQIINLNYSNPHLIRYYDYILEQDEIDGIWYNRSVYILSENSDYDLKTYIMKHGPLDLQNALKLVECLVGANYYLQKEIRMAHADIRPQNVRIILGQPSNQQNAGITFKLSYFDDVLRVNNHNNTNKRETLSYMAPELLSSFVISSNYFQQGSGYIPADELKNLIAECPDEIRYDPFRADVYAAGLSIITACTGMIYTLNPPKHQLEVYRDGRNEPMVISKNLNMIKNKFKCLGLNELLRVMLTQNPLLRCDFEELALRMSKIKEKNEEFPQLEMVREESNIKQDYELLKENYWELQEMVSEMKEKENEHKNTIEYLKEQLSRMSSYNQANQYTQFSTNNLLNDISAITPVDDDNASFLSSTPGSPKKSLGNLLISERDMNAMTSLVDQTEKIPMIPRKGSAMFNKV